MSLYEKCYDYLIGNRINSSVIGLAWSILGIISFCFFWYNLAMIPYSYWICILDLLRLPYELSSAEAHSASYSIKQERLAKSSLTIRKTVHVVDTFFAVVIWIGTYLVMYTSLLFKVALAYVIFTLFYLVHRYFAESAHKPTYAFKNS